MGAADPHRLRSAQNLCSAGTACLPHLPATSGDLSTGRGLKKSMGMGPKWRRFEECGADLCAMQDADPRFLNAGLMIDAPSPQRLAHSRHVVTTSSIISP